VDYEYSLDPEQYNYDTQMWECGGCNKSFHSQNHLIQHMKSGIHEVDKYSKIQKCCVYVVVMYITL
jgi:hypothetical protein